MVGLDGQARLRIVFAEIHGSSNEVSSALDMIGKALGAEPAPALPRPPGPPQIEAPAAKAIAPAVKRGRPAKPASAKAAAQQPKPPAKQPATPSAPKIQSPLTSLIVRELRSGPKAPEFLSACADDECPQQAEHLGKALASLRRNGHIRDIEGGFVELVRR